MKKIDSGLGVCLASSFFGHYAHCGFLCELDRAGVIPDRIAGASAGALAGGLWAGGLRGEELREEILKLNFRRAFFDLRAVFRIFGVASWSFSSGILGGNRMKRRLSRLIGDRRIEDLDAPALEVAVANLTKVCSEVRTEGPLIELILSSISMPLVFRVRDVEGEQLLDGGVGDETPYSHWLGQDGVEQILVHRIRFTGDDSSSSRRMTPGRVISACHAIPSAELERYRRAEAEASGKEVVFLETSYDPPAAVHRSRDGAAMFAAGEATARRWLESR